MLVDLSIFKVSGVVIPSALKRWKKKYLYVPETPTVTFRSHFGVTPETESGSNVTVIVAPGRRADEILAAVSLRMFPEQEGMVQLVVHGSPGIVPLPSFGSDAAILAPSREAF